jgi:hypothetical protein
MKKRCTILNSSFLHQLVQRNFLNHAHNCHCVSQKQDTEIRVHVCDIDINVWADGLGYIFAYYLLNAINTLFLILHINSYKYCVNYDFINKFQGKVFLFGKNKTIPVSKNTILQSTQQKSLNFISTNFNCTTKLPNWNSRKFLKDLAINYPFEKLVRMGTVNKMFDKFWVH